VPGTLHGLWLPPGFAGPGGLWLSVPGVTIHGVWVHEALVEVSLCPARRPACHPALLSPAGSAPPARRHRRCPTVSSRVGPSSQRPHPPSRLVHRAAGWDEVTAEVSINTVSEQTTVCGNVFAIASRAAGTGSANRAVSRASPGVLQRAFSCNVCVYRITTRQLFITITNREITINHASR